MINERRRWLYSKTVEPRIYEAGEVLKGDLYDSPAFDDPRTKCVTCSEPKGNQPPPDDIGPCTEPVKKYPSQMNKTELIEYGKLIGLEFTDSMTAKEMRTTIHDAIKEEDDGKED